MYVKLYSSILDSSIWSESPETRVVWVTMLAMADQDGFVRASPSGLARRANVTPEACDAACRTLESADPESKNGDHDGRRVEHISEGWQILNYKSYRSLRDPDMVRQQTRERVHRHREKDVTHGNAAKRPVTLGNASKRQAEAEAEAVNCSVRFDEFWATYPNRSGGNPKGKARDAYRARIASGVTEDELIAGASRYRKFCDTTKKTGTEYVKQAVYWLAEGYAGWAQDWALPQEYTTLAFPDYPDAA